MSLIRQLWLSITLITLFAFVGSLAVATLMARSYVEQQMRRQNIDTANSLALSMSQQSKDAATVELQIAALFDGGHFQSIALVDPFGKKMIERVQTRTDADVPAWLVRLLPIAVTPGRAQVTDGWKQFGVVSVVSHDKFAYAALRDGIVQLVGWFVLAALLSGVLGTLLIRGIRRPLRAVVDQAHAISERRFTSIEEPRTTELRSVARAMNEMVARLRQMFSDEAVRLDAVRHKVNHDDLTGLSRRDYFMAHLREVMTSETSRAVGCLVLLRLHDLNEINAALGRARTDELLKALGVLLWASGEGRPGQRAGRVNGAEFAIVCPTFESAQAAEADIAGRLERDFLPRWSDKVPDLYHIGVVRFRRGQNPGSVLAAADQALAAAQSKGPNASHAEEGEAAPAALPAEQWRALLTDATEAGRLQIACQPVVGRDGRILHEQCVMRLAAAPGAALLAAGDFMPMAARFDLTGPLNLGLVGLAVRHLESAGGEVAVALSGEALAETGFASRLGVLLENHQSVCRKLWIELPEWSAFRHFDTFRELTRTLKGLTCRVGIAQFGHRFDDGQKLTDLGLDYVKVHPGYVHGIDQNPANREFLRGATRMAQALGMIVIAMEVQTGAELAVLRELGFDGCAGPGVRA